MAFRKHRCCSVFHSFIVRIRKDEAKHFVRMVANIIVMERSGVSSKPNYTYIIQIKYTKKVGKSIHYLQSNYFRYTIYTLSYVMYILFHWINYYISSLNVRWRCQVDGRIGCMFTFIFRPSREFWLKSSNFGIILN